jgi:fluoroacetyl-CoA thioesterase
VGVAVGEAVADGVGRGRAAPPQAAATGTAAITANKRSIRRREPSMGRIVAQAGATSRHGGPRRALRCPIEIAEVYQVGVSADMVGQVETGTVVAGPEHYASKVFAGAPDVFSTPALGALIEATAAGWLAKYLDPGQMSVGTQIVINHTGATPPGLSVTVEAKVTAVEGRRVEFEWTARDDREQVGHGTHQRFVIDEARFMAGVEKKKAG